MTPIRKGRFIVLVGIDGSGKTSLLSSMGRGSLVTASWQDLRNHELPSAMAPEAPTLIKNRLADISRAMFIGGHLVAQYEYLVRPELEIGRDVLLDSYWYKVLAKEYIFGRAHPALTELCRWLPAPDAVILLAVEPRTAFYRKCGRLTPYEYLHTPDLNGYVRFQELLQERIESELADHPEVYRLDGDRDFPSVLGAATELIGQCTVPLQRVAERLS